jgi:hypothetical protein
MDTTNVPLSPSQIRFLLDLMMGCSMGITKHHAYVNKVDDVAIYNHLANCLPNHPDPTEDW